MHKLILILATMVLVSPVAAQMADRADLEAATRAQALGVEPAKSSLSLIDLSRLKWSHSYSLAFISGGGGSGSTGLLNTSMMYEFSSKLSLMVNVGLAHNAGAVWGDGNNDAVVLPGFVLDYHPSDKFRMTIGMQRSAGSLYGPGYYRSSLYRPGYWWSPY